MDDSLELMDAPEHRAIAEAPPRRRTPTDAVAVFPSAALRPVPSFTIGIPSGWRIDEAPDALGVLRVPEMIDGFWVNLLITTERVDHRAKLGHVASVALEQLKRQHPEVVVKADRVAEIDGRVMSIRVLELTAPDSGRELTIVQGLTAAPRAEGATTRDLFQLTGTCARADANRFGPVFVDTISSFRLT
jgi:hypothetical protein